MDELNFRNIIHFIFFFHLQLQRYYNKKSEWQSNLLQKYFMNFYVKNKFDKFCFILTLNETQSEI